MNVDRRSTFGCLEKSLVTAKWNDGVATHCSVARCNSSGREDLYRWRKFAPIKCFRVLCSWRTLIVSLFRILQRKLGKWKGTVFIHKYNVLWQIDCIYFSRFLSIDNSLPLFDLVFENYPVFILEKNLNNSSSRI